MMSAIWSVVNWTTTPQMPSAVVPWVQSTQQQMKTCLVIISPGKLSRWRP
jgi:hypothetical protein